MKTKRKAQTIICISLPPTLLRKIDRAASYQGISRSAYVRNCVCGRFRR